MTKPSVLIIGPTPPPYNGMSVATELVLNALSSRAEVIHLDTADRRDLSNVGKIDFLNLWLAAKHGLKYLWLLLTKRPHIVYVPVAQDSVPFLRDCLFLIPARLLGKKVVVHLHGGHFARYYKGCWPAMRRLIRCALGGAHRAIVLGRTLENIFDCVIPRDRVRVIPNGIPDHFGSYAETHANGHRHTILSLGTLMKEKGTLDLLQSLPLVINEIPDVRVIFAGEWLRMEEKSAAMKMIRQYNLESHTQFIGPVSPPLKFEVLKNAGLLAMPTYYKNEGHPYVILEAMSASLPVVSSNVGCIPETVIDGDNGFVLEPGNTQALAEKLALLLRDEDLRQKMASASRKRYLEFYTLDRFADQMAGVFRELS